MYFTTANTPVVGDFLCVCERVLCDGYVVVQRGNFSFRKHDYVRGGREKRVHCTCGNVVSIRFCAVDNRALFNPALLYCCPEKKDTANDMFPFTSLLSFSRSNPISC